MFKKLLLISFSFLIAGNFDDINHQFDRIEEYKVNTFDANWLPKPYPKHIQEVLGKYNIQDDSSLKIGTIYSSYPYTDRFPQDNSYNPVHDCVIIGQREIGGPRSHQQMILAHELAHRKYYHTHIRTMVNWTTLIATCAMAGALAITKKRFIFFSLMAFPGRYLAMQSLIRGFERHADYNAIQQCDSYEGIQWFGEHGKKEEQQVKQILQNMYPIIFTVDTLESDRMKTVSQKILKGLSFFRDHPVSYERVKYLEEYQKTGKIPFIYRLPDLLPFWPKRSD